MAYVITSAHRDSYAERPARLPLFNWRLACAVTANFAAWGLIAWAVRRLLMTP
jgi:hypothetical protein